MTTGEKIYNARRKAGMTQEELADKLGVTRQAVSKWEADAAFPETEKILLLCKLFSLSADDLLFPEHSAETQSADEEPSGGQNCNLNCFSRGFHYEYISKTRVFGVPLVHINIGFGLYRAKGIFAFGNVATGIFSFGILSLGVISCGVLALGLLAFGSFVLGLLLGAGAVAAGALAFGGVAVGIMTFGGCSIGYLATGGYAQGYYALGGVARGFIAVGNTSAYGEHAFTVPEMLAELEAFLNANLGGFPAEFIKSVARSLGN